MTSMRSPSVRYSPTANLPAFPWDTIAEFKATAAAHPDGIINLSVGTPADPVPAVARAALADAADSPGYPQVRGTDALRIAYADWLARTHQVAADPADVLPTIGSKELVASLPGQLGLGPGDTVAIPNLGYPTYDVGVAMCGATLLRTTVDDVITRDDVAMLWLNSPSNPTGAVLSVPEMVRVVRWAREHDVIVASDECYLDLGWEATPTSLLDVSVCGGDAAGLLALHSLSKRSNMAGYRLGFVSGDPALVGELAALRKHLGLMVPSPVQAAGIAALGDDVSVRVQRERYAKRRIILRDALMQAGFRIDHSEAGLYLWCTLGEPALHTLERLAAIGILVAPGTFYGPDGAEHVRVALTATDERIAAAASRLAGS